MRNRITSRCLSLLDRARVVVSSGTFRNATFSGLDHLLLPILWLIATPVFVARLGTDRFGIWMLVNSLLGFSGLFSFGLSDATIKYVSQYRALNDERRVARVIRSTLTLYLVLGVIAGVLISLTAPLLAGRVFKVDDPRDADLLALTLRICGVGIVVKMFDSVLQSVLQGSERFDLAATASMITNVVTVLLNLGLALLGYGLGTLLCASIAVLMASALVRVVIIRGKVSPGLDLRPSLDGPMLREILGFGIYSWMHGISGLLLGQADRLMIASMLGTRELAYYSVCLQLAQQIHGLPARAGAFLFPMTSAARAAGDEARLSDIYFRFTFLTTLAGIALGIPIFIMARSILTLWMGSGFAATATPILQILAFNFSLLATTIVPHYFLIGTGHVRPHMVLGLASGGAVVSSAIVLIPLMGVSGAAWSRLAVLPANLAARWIIHYWILEDRRWHVALTALAPVFATYGLATLWLTCFSPTFLRVDQVLVATLAASLVGLALGWGFCYLTIPARRKLVLG